MSFRIRQRASDAHPHEVRIAFDGDAVLFSDEAERVFQRGGLDAFQSHERDHARTPLRRRARSSRCSRRCSGCSAREPTAGVQMRIRTALVTARSAPAHERAIRTLMDWHIEVDEAMFLGGLPKGDFLREFEPDFFFDDQTGHIENAAPHVPAGHVAAGIVNAESRLRRAWLACSARPQASAAAGALEVEHAHAAVFDADHAALLQRLQRLVDALARQADEVAELLLRDAQQLADAGIEHRVEQRRQAARDARVGVGQAVDLARAR